jgi:hypothetical protein
MKFSSFDNHWTCWDTISRYEKQGHMQGMHEVLVADAPRCLYFDVDGKAGYSELHHEIMNWLQMYVRWVFAGDRCEWDEGDPQPVVLATDNPDKYSCHVVFPQIQFSNFAHQQQYMKLLLPALSKLSVQLEDGEQIPILEKLVDHVPYTQFQNFRAPYACKLKDGQLRSHTQLRPEASSSRMS